MTDDLKEYFLERYLEAKWRVVPGHWPDFKSKEEVDRWIAKMNLTIGAAFSVAFDDKEANQ